MPEYLCRAEACGCKAGPEDTFYCDHCAQYLPICPQCGAVYGEHRLECTVADGYTCSNEGPWATEAEAVHFAEAECGLPWQIAKGNRGWYVMLKRTDD